MMGKILSEAEWDKAMAMASTSGAVGTHRLAAKQALRAHDYALREALAFYADPGTYFAVAMFFDPPCGELMDDFSEAEDWGDWSPGRPVPGKRAREALLGEESDA